VLPDEVINTGRPPGGAVLDLKSVGGSAEFRGRPRILPCVPPVVRTAGAAVLLVLAGCIASAPAGVSVGPAADASPREGKCTPVELRTPSGTLIDLTGTWFGVDDQTYYSFLQIGRCMWASSTGGPHVFDQVRICCQELMLHGTLASDFTIGVDFAYVPLDCTPGGPDCRGEVGTATLMIEIENGPDGEVITLHKVGGASAADRASNLGVTLWTRVTGDLTSPSPGT
jgi:hypothetical protein